MSIKRFPLIFIIAIVLCILISIKIFMHFKSPTKASEKITPTVLVRISPATSMLLAPSLITYGTVNFSPEQVQQLTLANENIVRNLWVSPNQKIKKGDPLITLTPTANTNLNFQNAKITVDFSQQELEHLLQLKSQYLATNAEVQAARLNLAKAEATMNSLLPQQKQTLYANADITIMTVNVQVGQIVQPGAPLLTFADNQSLQVRLGVETEDLAKIKVGQTVTITNLHGDNTPAFKTSLQQIMGQINAVSGLVDIIVSLTDAPGLIPGSIVRGEIFLQSPTSVIVVPHSAVLYDNQKAYVFVDKNDIAEQRWVTTGEDNGQFVIILDGLSAGEQVVVLGNYELENGVILRVESST